MSTNRIRRQASKALQSGRAAANCKAHANGTARVNGTALVAKPSPPSQTALTATMPDAKAKGRTADGKFSPGNKCGKGNPFARRLGAMRSAFLEAVTDADVAAVAHKLWVLAVAGDVQAAQVFLSYAIGKPRNAVDPDRLDLEDFAILDSAPTAARALAVMLTAVDPAGAAEFVRSFTEEQRVKDVLIPKDAKSAATSELADELKARTGRPRL
jgi:hypothetical protein